MSNQFRSNARIKQDAKKIKKETGCTHSEALELAVQKYGFSSYHSYLNPQKKVKSVTGKIVPIPKLRKEFSKRALDYSIFIPTETGLKKSIIDATAPMRGLFESEGFHDYSIQKQGKDYKIKTAAYFVNGEITQETVVSLYRPKTKKGDPRMWFKGLKDFSSPNDLLALFFYNKQPWLINLSRVDNLTLFKNFLDSITQNQSIAEELLNKLKELATTPISSSVVGDTAIGMAIEAALGIPPNSDKKPDYKGIELKSSRKRTKTRKNLFAQVADWNLSKLSSSKEILDLYGYQREVEFKLYCTLSALKANPQGLMFKLKKKGEEVHEVHIKDGSIAVWSATLLKDRLLEKHSETFWIEADSKIENGNEVFYLKSVIHTRAPLQNQIIPLIEEGVITMDHLIKRTKTGAAKEKGPIFKIKPASLDLLFPEPIKYDLLN